MALAIVAVEGPAVSIIDRRRAVATGSVWTRAALVQSRSPDRVVADVEIQKAVVIIVAPSRARCPPWPVPVTRTPALGCDVLEQRFALRLCSEIPEEMASAIPGDEHVRIAIIVVIADRQAL